MKNIQKIIKITEKDIKDFEDFYKENELFDNILENEDYIKFFNNSILKFERNIILSENDEDILIISDFKIENDKIFIKIEDNQDYEYQIYFDLSEISEYLRNYFIEYIYFDIFQIIHDEDYNYLDKSEIYDLFDIIDNLFYIYHE